MLSHWQTFNGMGNTVFLDIIFHLGKHWVKQNSRIKDQLGMQLEAVDLTCEGQLRICQRRHTCTKWRRRRIECILQGRWERKKRGYLGFQAKVQRGEHTRGRPLHWLHQRPPWVKDNNPALMLLGMRQSLIHSWGWGGRIVRLCLVRRHHISIRTVVNRTRKGRM